MSTSERTHDDVSPEERDRLERLYRAQHQDTELDTSPADLDELIRAHAKEAVSAAASGDWHAQRRYTWATAAAVVMTSALFLALPDNDLVSTPESALDTPTSSSPAPALLPIAASDSASRAELELQVDSASETHTGAIQKKLAAPARTRAAPASGLLKGLSHENAIAHSRTRPQCYALKTGPFTRVCNMPDSTTYILHPKAPSDCGVLTLDDQATQPMPEADSNKDQFIYRSGSHTWRVTCGAGKWDIQSLARGR